MNLRQISLSAVRHLQEEPHQIEEQAKMKPKIRRPTYLGCCERFLSGSAGAG
jgi:hypothetical protein